MVPILGVDVLFILMLVGFSIISSFIGKKWIGRIVYVSSVAILSLGLYIVLFWTSHGVFLLDPLSRLFIFILVAVSPPVLIYSTRYVKENKNRFFFLMFLFMASMYGFVTANNVFLFFVFWEVMSICSFLLISFRYKDTEAIRAGNKCFILTQLGGLLVLAALIALSIGTSNWTISGILQNYTAIPSGVLFMAGLLLVLGGLSKSSIFPFSWLPDAMKAPTPVSALLHSATMVNAGVFIIVRFMPVIGQFPLLLTLLILFAFISMLYACLSALFETDIKRILAFSTIANLSYIFATLALFSSLSEAASIFHLLNHAFLKAGLFLAIGVVVASARHKHLEFLKGGAQFLGRAKYGLVFLILAACSLPPTNAFLSKWSIYGAWLSAFPVGIILIALGTVLTIAYYSRIVTVLFQERKVKPRMCSQYHIAILPIAAVCLLFGVTALGYEFFVQAIVHPTLSLYANFSLFLLLFSLVLGVGVFRRVSVDRTGPFVGGEDIRPHLPVEELYRDYQKMLTRVSDSLNIDRLYKKISKTKSCLKYLTRFDHALTEKFVIATALIVFILMLAGILMI